MGSCHSTHLFYTNNNNNNNKECFVCWEEITEIYVKCRICKIILHEKCAIRYIQNDKNAKCPHCRNKKPLYLYKNGECIKLK